MRARIAHIVPSDRIAYFLLRARLAQVRDAGFEVSVICGRVAYGRELEESGLQVIHLPFAREIAPITDVRCAWGLYHALRRGRFDIVHSHNPKGGLLGPFVGRLARSAALVHTVHGFLFNENSTGLYRQLALGVERWTAHWCDHLLFQSSEDYDYARSRRFKEPHQLHLIGNGIDQSRFDRDRYPQARRRKRAELGLEEQHLVVGMVGRLVREKGFGEFFAMASRISRALPQVRFLVVGITEEDQSDRLDPHQLSAEYGIRDRCIILEQRRDMPELYLCMDAAVLPSYREGIPRALLEAAAMGVPIAASDIRGCREVIVDGESGILFPLKDVDALTETVRLLLGDGDMRRRLGEAGRRRVLEHYTESGTAERLIGFYHGILEQRRLSVCKLALTGGNGQSLVRENACSMESKSQVIDSGKMKL